MPKWLIENPSKASRAELLAAARAAAKTANQRLVRLERAQQEGRLYSTNAAYSLAMNYLAESGRRRFQERPGKDVSRNELLRQYNRTLEFLGAKSSTVRGITSIERNRYNTYKAAGYSGTFQQFRQDMQKLWSSEWASFGYGSQEVYMIATSGRDSITDFTQMLNDARRRAATSPGRDLIQRLKKRS